MVRNPLVSLAALFPAFRYLSGCIPNLFANAMYALVFASRGQDPLKNVDRTLKCRLVIELVFGLRLQV